MSLQAIPLFPGIPGGMELAVILLIAILLFGANKIPKLARSTGEAMGEFKKGREQVEQELADIRDGPADEIPEDGDSDLADVESEPDDATETETETETEG